jgi:hypothetical protein
MSDDVQESQCQVSFCIETNYVRVLGKSYCPIYVPSHTIFYEGEWVTNYVAVPSGSA